MWELFRVVLSISITEILERTVHIVPPPTQMADRMEVTYTCVSGHEFTRVFAADITVPGTWDCPRCGKTGTSESEPMANDTSAPTRSHWDMLLERRTIGELTDMLAIRAEELRALR